MQILGCHKLWHQRTFADRTSAQHENPVDTRNFVLNIYKLFKSHFPSSSNHYLYGPFPGLDVLLSRLDAKLHVADVRADGTGCGAVRCSVLLCKSNLTLIYKCTWIKVNYSLLRVPSDLFKTFHHKLLYSYIQIFDRNRGRTLFKDDCSSWSFPHCIYIAIACINTYIKQIFHTSIVECNFTPTWRWLLKTTHSHSIVCTCCLLQTLPYKTADGPPVCSVYPSGGWFQTEWLTSLRTRVWGNAHKSRVWCICVCVRVCSHRVCEKHEPFEKLLAAPWIISRTMNATLICFFCAGRYTKIFWRYKNRTNLWVRVMFYRSSETSDSDADDKFAPIYAVKSQFCLQINYFGEVFCVGRFVEWMCHSIHNPLLYYMILLINIWFTTLT